VANEEAYGVLRAMPGLADVPDRLVAWLAAIVEPHSFLGGEHLMVEGETRRDCFFIESGETVVTSRGQVRGRTGAGEVQGEIALLFRRPRIATTTALTDVRVLCLPADRWDRLVDEDPAAAAAFAEGLVARLRVRFGQRPED
jgi:CRP-like cAMP-binding protein